MAPIIQSWKHRATATQPSSDRHWLFGHLYTITRISLFGLGSDDGQSGLAIPKPPKAIDNHHDRKREVGRLSEHPDHEACKDKT